MNLSISPIPQMDLFKDYSYSIGPSGKQEKHFKKSKGVLVV